jgi:uncharacterized Zn finger protein (UPF0148 family)
MIRNLCFRTAVLISLFGVAADLSGCAALVATGAVVLGATTYDVMTQRECPNCKKVVRKETVVCPYCKKDLVQPDKTETAK